MIPHARTAARLAVLVAMLAAPLVVAAQAPAAEAKPKKQRTVHQGARPKASPGGAARATGSAHQVEGSSQPAGDPNAIVRWEDEDGGIHYTHAYEVPERFRPKVRTVTTTVGTVPLDRIETKKAPAAAEGPASIAAPPANAQPSTNTQPPASAQPPAPAAPPAAGAPQSALSGAPGGSTTTPPSGASR